MPESNPLCVILAAGGSSRLGRPKQLLPFNGRPLLQAAIEAARALHFAVPPLVVLGAEAGAIREAVDFSNCTAIENVDWRSGMASSIVCAVSHIQKVEPAVSGAIFLTADQPHVTTLVLGRLVAEANEHGAQIAISEFAHLDGRAKVIGPPVYFDRSFFPELLGLEGDIGARKVVQAHLDKTVKVDFPQGAIDIDTDDDYRKLLQAAAL